MDDIIENEINNISVKYIYCKYCDFEGDESEFGYDPEQKIVICPKCEYEI